MSESSNSYIPKLPKGIGFSKALLLTLFIGVIAIILLFLFFLQYYSPKTKESDLDRVEVHETIDNFSSTDAIHHLQAKPPEMAHAAVTELNTVQPMSLEKGSVINTLIQGFTQDDYKDASNATLSVYHAENPINPNERQQFGMSGTSDNSLPNLPNPASLAQKTDPFSIQNKQGEKIAFSEKAGRDNKNRIRSRLLHPVSPFEIKAGTVIPATLITGINSDLPGNLIARVRRDIFDTRTGNLLLIPQGASLLGKYDSQIAFGQNRLLIVWSRLLFPNGDSINLESMPGVDLKGMSGFQDIVNHHYLKIYGSALLYSLFTAAAQLSQASNKSDTPSGTQIATNAVGEQLSQTGAQMIAKNLNVQPTIVIREGMNFNVMLTRDMVLPSSYHL